MQLQKKFTLLLAALMVAPVLASCASEEAETQPADTASADTTPAETEITRATTPDTLPDGLDFGGESIRIIQGTSDEHMDEYYVEEDTGEALCSAIYTRQTRVEERLNVKIESIITDEACASIPALTAITAGVDDYDIVAGSQWRMMQQTTMGLYHNVYDLPYLDLDQIWWNQLFVDASALGENRAYFLCGDATLSMLRLLGVIYVNGTVYENAIGSVEDLYETVLAGDWTFDMMYSNAETAYQDTNGNGAADEGDIFGYASHKISQVDYLVGGARIKFTEFDEAGIPTLVVNNERSIGLYEKLYKLLNENKGTFILPASWDGELQGVDMMKEDRLLFLPFRTNISTYLRDMESAYAILPAPKYDDTQEAYSTIVHDSARVLAVPVTNSKLEATGAFLEAFAAESYRTVTDVYFSTILKEKLARDEYVAEVLDIILEGVYFDFASLHSYALESIGQIFRDPNGTFVSKYQSKEKTYLTKLDELIEAYLGEE
ncbi:MAG: hypothetical protein IJ480_07330 [Clostridia bacterium]|nr:hypothetical protein [Clostridia bacterium]